MSWAHPRMESLGECEGPKGPPKERPRHPTLPLFPRDISALHRCGLISAPHSWLYDISVIISTSQVRKSSQTGDMTYPRSQSQSPILRSQDQRLFSYLMLSLRALGPGVLAQTGQPALGRRVCTRTLQL